MKKKYRLREGSPLWVLAFTAGFLAFVVLANIPTTVDAWMGIY